MSLLIRGATQIVQITRSGQLFKIGAEMEDVALLQKTENEGVSIAVDEYVSLRLARAVFLLFLQHRSSSKFLF